MLGYMNAKAAIAKGFTHHGKYYGVPVWLAPDDPEFPVIAKWSPLEVAISAAVFIEQTIRPVIFPNDEPCFQFEIGTPIKGEKS